MYYVAMIFVIFKNRLRLTSSLISVVVLVSQMVQFGISGI